MAYINAWQMDVDVVLSQQQLRALQQKTHVRDTSERGLSQAKRPGRARK